LDAGGCAEEVDYTFLAGIPFTLLALHRSPSSEDRSSITCSSKESLGAVRQGVDEGMVGSSGRNVAIQHKLQSCGIQSHVKV